MKDVLIKNALVYDGTGAAPFCSDVLLSGTKIARIGHIQEEKDCEVVDAAGLALAGLAPAQAASRSCSSGRASAMRSTR